MGLHAMYDAHPRSNPSKVAETWAVRFVDHLGCEDVYYYHTQELVEASSRQILLDGMTVLSVCRLPVR